MSDIVEINSIADDYFIDVNDISRLSIIKINGIENFWPNFSGDDFTGVTNDPPNTKVWTNFGAEANILINGNKARASVDSATVTRRMQSLFTLSGDFDIQIDFDMVTHPNTNSWFAALAVWDSDYTNRVYIQRSYTTTYINHYSHVDVPGYSYTRDTGHDDLTGKLRLVRVGTTITSYFWTGSAWTLVKATALAGYANDMNVYFWGSVSDTKPTVVVDFDNFVINSGTVVRPV